jgi:hypothetical protein
MASNIATLWHYSFLAGANMSAQRIKAVFCDPYCWAKGMVFVALAYLTFVVILPSTLSTWEEVHTVSSLDVTPAMRAEVVDALAQKVRQRYLDAQKGTQIASALRKAARDGDYDDIRSPTELARLLTSELIGSSRDLHMRVIFSPAEVPHFSERNFPSPDKNDEQSLPAWLIDRLGRYMAHFGVEEVTQSDAGVGYLQLTGFFRPYLSAEKYAAAMNRLAHSRALIIDLRKNSGGSRDAVALLASYFFDQPTHLSDVVAPRTGERLHVWTRKDIEGRHYGSTRPVYILTSRATSSAGEDFAYAMQTQKRAIIVGEATWGGAHPTAPLRLNSHFFVAMPVAESISPLTHSNWEGAREICGQRCDHCNLEEAVSHGDRPNASRQDSSMASRWHAHLGLLSHRPLLADSG